MPRLTYNRELFGFSFTAKGGIAYMVQVTQDFKHWVDLKTINGTGDQVEFIDPRQPLVPFKRNFYRVKVVECDLLRKHGGKRGVELKAEGK